MPEPPDDLPPLDPELAALVTAYENETARSDADVNAAMHAVSAKVGTAAGGAAVGGLSTAAKVGALAVIAGVVAVLVANSGTEPAAPEPQARVVETTPSVAPEPRALPEPEPEPEVEASEPVEPDPQPEAPTSPEPKAKPKPKPKPQPAQDTLAEELQLLGRARASLRSGDAEAALRTLGSHRRKFPSSTLAEERDATEISALCAAGRGDDARAKVAKFSRRHGAPKRDLLADCE